MKLSGLLSVVLVVSGLVACGQSSGPSVTTSAGGAAPVVSAVPAKKEVGLVMKTLTNPFFVEMERGARRAETEFGVTLKVKTATQETSIEQQIQLVDDLIAAKVGAIVIAPGDSQRLIPSLKKAVAAGIYVVNIDNRLDPDAVKQAEMAPIPFIGVDNAAGAYKAGKFLVEGVTVPTEAVILEGIRSANNAHQRMEGAKRALLENKAIKLVASESANWEIKLAYDVTRDMFAKHPKVKLLFAANDMMAMGAIKYLQENGKTHVKVVGYDALDEALVEIKGGRMSATIDQQAAEQGYQGVKMAVTMMQGAQVPALTTIETRLVTATNNP